VKSKRIEWVYCVNFSFNVLLILKSVPINMLVRRREHRGNVDDLDTFRVFSDNRCGRRIIMPKSTFRLSAVAWDE